MTDAEAMLVGLYRHPSEAAIHADFWDERGEGALATLLRMPGTAAAPGQVVFGLCLTFLESPGHGLAYNLAMQEMHARLSPNAIRDSIQAAMPADDGSPGHLVPDVIPVPWVPDPGAAARRFPVRIDCRCGVVSGVWWDPENDQVVELRGGPARTAKPRPGVGQRVRPVHRPAVVPVGPLHPVRPVVLLGRRAGGDRRRVDDAFPAIPHGA